MLWRLQISQQEVQRLEDSGEKTHLKTNKQTNEKIGIVRPLISYPAEIKRKIQIKEN